MVLFHFKFAPPREAPARPVRIARKLQPKPKPEELNVWVAPSWLKLLLFAVMCLLLKSASC